MTDLSDKFSYMNEGELIELKHSCQECLREHKDNKCEFYPDGIPDEILNFKKQCKYEVRSSDVILHGEEAFELYKQREEEGYKL